MLDDDEKKKDEIKLWRRGESTDKDVDGMTCFAIKINAWVRVLVCLVIVNHSRGNNKNQNNNNNNIEKKNINIIAGSLDKIEGWVG